MRGCPAEQDWGLDEGERRVAVKETDLWQRLQDQLGAGYYRVWAAEYSLAELQNRTVVEAVAAGVPVKTIWRAVWAALELPARER